MVLAAKVPKVIQRRPTTEGNMPVTPAHIAHAPLPHRRAARLALGAVMIAGLIMLPACGGGNRAQRTNAAAAQVNTIGVNAFLWRAAMETASFAPLISTDSQGGVIVTDWYANPGNPNERVKLTISILDQDLRADALRVNASRQVIEGSGWVEAPVQAATVQKLEDIILTKARDLRRQAMSKT